MTKPTIHLNGTSGKELLESYLKTGDALRDAIKAHNEAGPNPRDYYVQSNEAFTLARNEHVARARKLQEVLAELQELQAHVFDSTPSHKL